MKTARLIQEIGTRAWLRVYWDSYEGSTSKKTCPNGFGSGQPGCHDGQILLADSNELANWELGGAPKDHADAAWPTRCDYCGAPVPDVPYQTAARVPHEGIELNRQVFRKRMYNTASGQPEPGDLFFADWHHHNGHCLFWDNCGGPHLIAVLPNGRDWDIDSRASNCTMPDDRIHRCWIRTGTPPNVHVDKNGRTCQAGAGSIAVTGYHGFLHHGVFSDG